MWRGDHNRKACSTSVVGVDGKHCTAATRTRCHASSPESGFLGVDRTGCQGGARSDKHGRELDGPRGSHSQEDAVISSWDAVPCALTTLRSELWCCRWGRPFLPSCRNTTRGLWNRCLSTLSNVRWTAGITRYVCHKRATGTPQWLETPTVESRSRTKQSAG